VVPEDPWRLIVDKLEEAVASLPLMARGAESELRRGLYAGVRAVFKVRRKKAYMDPVLDEDLRRQRTLKESRILVSALAAGARVPRVLAVYPRLGIIVMELVDGPRLKEALEEGSNYCGLAREAGRLVGTLHEAGIAHGDPTTSNFIVSRTGLYIIDFGLAEFTSDVEDMAVDLHLFRRAAESTHSSIAGSLYECFLEGYRAARREQAEPVIKRAEEIKLRGRYVEERRTVWGAQD